MDDENRQVVSENPRIFSDVYKRQGNDNALTVDHADGSIRVFLQLQNYVLKDSSGHGCSSSTRKLWKMCIRDRLSGGIRLLWENQCVLKSVGPGADHVPRHREILTDVEVELNAVGPLGIVGDLSLIHISTMSPAVSGPTNPSLRATMFLPPACRSLSACC